MSQLIGVARKENKKITKQYNAHVKTQINLIPMHLFCTMKFTCLMDERLNIEILDQNIHIEQITIQISLFN